MIFSEDILVMVNVGKLAKEESALANWKGASIVPF